MFCDVFFFHLTANILPYTFLESSVSFYFSTNTAIREFIWFPIGNIDNKPKTSFQLTSSVNMRPSCGLRVCSLSRSEKERKSSS
jgi:hypothetical protein